MATEEEKKAAEATEAKKKADEEADKALETKVSKIVNAALTSHSKRTPAGVTAEDLEKLLDAREAKKAELEEEKKKAAAGGGSGKGGADNAPEIAKLTKELEALKKESSAAKAEAAETKSKQQTSEDNTTIIKTLEAAGVTVAGRARSAMQILRAEGLVKRTEDGLVGIDKKGDEQDLAETITEFLKTEDGKIFLPPSGAGGGGSKTDRGGGTGKSPKSSKERAGAALARHRSGTSD